MVAVGTAVKTCSLAVTGDLLELRGKCENRAGGYQGNGHCLLVSTLHRPFPRNVLELASSALHVAVLLMLGS